MAHKDTLAELRQPTKRLREHIPAVFEGYGTLSAAAFADGALDAKTKELIAVAKQCDGCIASHARGAARRGATSEEVADALGIAIVMDGGPGTVHAPRAFAAFEEFSTS